MTTPIKAIPDVSKLTVGIPVGTGPQGRDLANRLARASQCTTIGSRTARSGASAAAELAAMPDTVPNMLTGGDNQFAADSDLVIIALPYTHRARHSCQLAQRPSWPDRGRPRQSDRVRLSRPIPAATPEGSAAQQTAMLLPRSPTAAAFHHTSAELLTDASIAHLECDVLVLSDDPSTAGAVQALADRAGMRGISAGPLSNAFHIEATAANSIAMSLQHRHDIPPPLLAFGHDLANSFSNARSRGGRDIDRRAMDGK